MRLLNINGRLVYKSVSKYRIVWDGKSRSQPQFLAKQFLKTYWSTQVVYEEFPVYGTLMRVDILNATKNIAIEINGAQHSQFSKHFHGSRTNYFNSIQRDMLKRGWLEKNGFNIIEIEDHEVAALSLEFFVKKFNISIV